jgi:hypothetical protein
MTNYRITNKADPAKKTTWVVSEGSKGAAPIIARARADPNTYDLEEIKVEEKPKPVKPEKSGPSTTTS